MRLFEKRSACLDGRRSLFKRCLNKFEFPQILSRYSVSSIRQLTHKQIPFWQFYLFCIPLVKCLIRTKTPDFELSLRGKRNERRSKPLTFRRLLRSYLPPNDRKTVIQWVFVQALITDFCYLFWDNTSRKISICLRTVSLS